MLVVPRKKLFSEGEFNGFLSGSEVEGYIGRILENFEYKERTDELESDSTLKQIIPYVWIVNPLEKKVFAYRRASGKENYNEKKLMNKWSCGVGGHIDREDLEKRDEVIMKAMMRELKEEVYMEEYPVPRVVGYLNDDSNDVGRVHFGVVAVAEVKGNVGKADSEMAYGRFYSVEELESVFSDPNKDVETWTRLSWPFVKSYLNSLK